MSDEITVPDELKGNVFITKLSELYGCPLRVAKAEGWYRVVPG